MRNFLWHTKRCKVTSMYQLVWKQSRQRRIKRTGRWRRSVERHYGLNEGERMSIVSRVNKEAKSNAKFAVMWMASGCRSRSRSSIFRSAFRGICNRPNLDKVTLWLLFLSRFGPDEEKSPSAELPKSRDCYHLFFSLQIQGRTRSKSGRIHRCIPTAAQLPAFKISLIANSRSVRISSLILCLKPADHRCH